MDQELSYCTQISETHPTFHLSGGMGRKGGGRNKAHEVALQCRTMSARDYIPGGAILCVPPEDHRIIE